MKRTALVLLVALPLLGAARLVLLGRRQPAVSLDSLAPLLAAGRIDEAEAKLTDYLLSHPESPQAHLLMAQAALGRPDAKPRKALDHLFKIKASEPRFLAVARLNEGKAQSLLGRQDAAERAWKEALRLDPMVAEAGWDLLGLYHAQGRREDAQRLAMSLFEREPDRRDRVQLLVELLRQDAQPIGAPSLISTLLPIVKAHPEDVHTTIALGRAYVKQGQHTEGIGLIERLVERSPANSMAWEALLWALDESARTEVLARSLERLPHGLAADHRFARYRGALALKSQQWVEAVHWYKLAHEADRADVQVVYRLCQALRAAGLSKEQEKYNRLFETMDKARGQALLLYEEADADKTLGATPHPGLYQRLADQRERMGRPDEAIEWHRLVLADDPADGVSQAAMRRLSAARRPVP